MKPSESSDAEPTTAVDVRLGGVRRVVCSATAAGVLVTLKALYRLRVYGTVPRRPVPTLVVANHQHDIESLLVPALLYRRGREKRLVCSVASQRLVEPWFLPSRAPRVLAPLAARAPFAWLLDQVGLLPIENEPRHRPLASFAAEVLGLSGDLRADAVFTPEALAGLGPRARSLRLNAIATLAHARSAQVPVGLSALREPWRTTVRGRTRARIEAQMLAVEAHLAAGATVFLTPEGHVSHDGTLGPMRLVLARLLPLAQMVLLCASSLDPFAERRLTAVLHFSPPRPGVPVASALAAARPVTLSQVVAAALATTRSETAHGGVAVDTLTTAVGRHLSELPTGAYVDPWLLDGPLAPKVGQAVRTMAAVGLLAPEGARYVPTERRGDPRLPGIDDALGFHATALRETCRAAREIQVQQGS